MSGLRFDMAGADFALLDKYGPDNIFTRAANGSAASAGFPLFDETMSGHVSGSDHFDADVLGCVSSQNEQFPSIEDGTRFVLTGQQPGLLLGPLYTFLKAVTAVSMAGRLSVKTGKPVVPLFWVASEDHDILEVNRVTVRGERFVHKYGRPLERGKVPQVGDIGMEDAREPLLEFLGQMLPQTEFTQWVMDMVSSCDYENYSSAFSGLLKKLFEEWQLRIVDPITIRQWTGLVLAELVARWPQVLCALDKGTEALRSAGIKPVLDSAGFFEIHGGFRVPVEIDNDRITLSSGEVSFEGAEREIRSRPGDFSPGAALRPVLQDAVLPVVCTVGGPSELGYFWQIQPIYTVADVTPSLPAPRISATFVENKIIKTAERAGIGIDVFLSDRAAAETALAPPTDDPLIGKWKDEVEGFLKVVDEMVGDNPDKGISKAKNSLEAQIEKLSSRLEDDRLQADGLGRKRLQKVLDALMPEDGPQERVESAIGFLNSYGPDFVRCAVETLDPCLKQHQIIMISADKEA